jgi:hypothetical protein
MWTDWTRVYVDAPFPRLIIRFEDILFHAEKVIKIVSECVGIPLLSNATYRYCLGRSKDRFKTSTFMEAMVKNSKTAGLSHNSIPKFKSVDCQRNCGGLYIFPRRRDPRLSVSIALASLVFRRKSEHGGAFVLCGIRVVRTAASGCLSLVESNSSTEAAPSAVGGCGGGRSTARRGTENRAPTSRGRTMFGLCTGAWSGFKKTNNHTNTTVIGARHHCSNQYTLDWMTGMTEEQEDECKFDETE